MIWRFRYSLASMLWLVVLAAVVLGVTTSFPTSLKTSHLTLWAALMNEAAFLAIALTIVTTVGSRTRYDFALGFVAFAATNWVFDRPLPQGSTFKEEVLWHSIMIYYCAEQAQNHGLFDIDSLGYQFAWRHTDVNSFLRAAETLLLGVGGGLYAQWLARRRGKKVTTVPQPPHG